MTEKCFAIGTIQAFLDGELNDDSLELAARHFSVCDDCARLLAEAENESAFAFSALDGELNSLVPSERIRANLYEAIAAEKKSLWRKIFGKVNFSNPSIAAFASLALVVGIFTTLFILRENRTTNNETAKIETSKSIGTQNGGKQIESVFTNRESTVESPISTIAPRIEKAVVKPNLEKRAAIQNADFKVQKTSVENRQAENKTAVADNTAPPAKNENLAGEESYIKTIATLSETVNSRKDETLKPSARVAFERDLAVVDDSISKMRKEVRRNPKNEAARELLRASYQNKIDLLGSVADKSDLMAALK